MVVVKNHRRGCSDILFSTRDAMTIQHYRDIQHARRAKARTVWRHARTSCSQMSEDTNNDVASACSFARDLTGLEM